MPTILFIFLTVFITFSDTSVIIGDDNEVIDPFGRTPALFPLVYAAEGQGGLGWRRRCPLCDSSVCSYCSDKLFHDSCCCHNSNNPYDRLPQQCQYADCSFLHANSCQEHKLITACCCISSFCSSY